MIIVQPGDLLGYHAHPDFSSFLLSVSDVPCCGLSELIATCVDGRNEDNLVTGNIYLMSSCGIPKAASLQANIMICKIYLTIFFFIICNFTWNVLYKMKYK